MTGSSVISRRRLMAAASLMALVSGAFAGFASGAQAADKSVKIGFAVYSNLQMRWQFDAALFKEQAEKNGDTVIIEYANGDPQKQTQQVQSMMARGIDVLVIASANVSVGGTLVEQAKAEGVKTIAYDIGVQDGAPHWMVRRKQDEVSRKQVEAAVKFAPKGNYAVFKGDAANDLAQINSPIYDELLKQHPDINVVYSDWIPGFSPVTAQRVAEDILTRTKDDMQAFIVINDGMSTAVVQALQDSGIAGKVFVSGLDADEANLNYIARGLQTMSIYTPLDQMAQSAADAAHELGNDRTPKATSTLETKWGTIPVNDIAVTTVDSSNLCDFVTKTAPKGWARLEAVFKGSDIECKP